MDIRAVSVVYNNVDQIGEREAVVSLSTGSEVHICVCYESWQQYGGTTPELRVTMPFADMLNDWLHGIDIFPPLDEDEAVAFINEESE